jgi:hypothetical protein
VNCYFDYLFQICGQNATIKAFDLREFVNAFLSIDESLMLRRSLNHGNKLCNFTEDALEKTKFHIWFIFMIINIEIGEQVYEEHSFIRNIFRIGFIISPLCRMMRNVV